jgi:hypothetical protein
MEKPVTSFMMDKPLSLCAILTAAGCDYKGVPVAFASACDKANDDTTAELASIFLSHRR